MEQATISVSVAETKTASTTTRSSNTFFAKALAYYWKSICSFRLADWASLISSASFLVWMLSLGDSPLVKPELLMKISIATCVLSFILILFSKRKKVKDVQVIALMIAILFIMMLAVVK